MSSARHKHQTLQQGIHGIVAIEYADEAARLSATGFVSEDLYKVAYQQDDGYFYVLIDTESPTWALLNGGGSGGGNGNPTGAAGGDLDGTYPNPSVVDLTISGEVQGSLLYYNGSNWTTLSPGNSGEVLSTQGVGANPLWVSQSSSGGDGNQSLTSVLSNGNTTDGYDIILSTGDVIESEDGFVTINDGLIINGNIDVNNNKIINLLDPVDAQDAATKGYVDDVLSGSGGSQSLSQTLNIGNETDGYDIDVSSGDAIDFQNEIDIQRQGATYISSTNSILTIHGILDVDDNRITNVATPVSGTDAVNKNYVDGYVATQDLQSVLSVGNETDGYDIHLSSGDSIDSDDGVILAQDGTYIAIAKETSTFPSLILNGDYAAVSEYIIALAGRSGNAMNLNIIGAGSEGNDGNGGNVVITPGAANGSGTDGYVGITDASSRLVASINETTAEYYVNIQFDTSFVNPSLFQESDSTATITGDLFTIHSQDVSGNTSTTGGELVIRAGDATGAGGTHTGGKLTLKAGSATGGSGTRTGGSVLLLPGTGASSKGNISLITEASSYESMEGGIFIGDSTNDPVGNPSNGGFLYVNSGSLIWKSSNGDVQTLAPTSGDGTTSLSSALSVDNSTDGYDIDISSDDRITFEDGGFIYNESGELLFQSSENYISTIAPNGDNDLDGYDSQLRRWMFTVVTTDGSAVEVVDLDGYGYLEDDYAYSLSIFCIANDNSGGIAAHSIRAIVKNGSIKSGPTENYEIEGSDGGDTYGGLNLVEGGDGGGLSLTVTGASDKHIVWTVTVDVLGVHYA